jgi:transcriptional regulator with XRE-family HTH domain
LGITQLNAALLGLRIRQARERRGLSQEDLAAAVSKDQRAISEYEAGKRKLAVTDLPTFATVLEVPLLFFFEEDASLHNLDAALLNYFHELPSPELRQAAIDIIRIFSRSIYDAQNT